MRTRLTIAALLGAAAALPLPALAQGLPDLSDSVTQTGQLGRTAADAVAGARPQIATEAEQQLAGEAGVYLLTTNQILSVTASGGLGYTDNPERNADNLSGSGFAEASLTAGLSTRLGETVDFGLAASLGGREYFDNPGASNRNLSASLSAGVPITGPLYLGVVGFGGWNFDHDFNGSVGFYGGGANLSAALPLGQRTLVRPGVAVNRQWSEVAENDSTTASAGVDLVHALRPDLRLAGRVAVSRRWFDDFYEDVTFVARRDWTYSASASAVWTPVERVSVAASLGYEKQDSSFFLSSYEAFEGSALVSVTARF